MRPRSRLTSEQIEEARRLRDRDPETYTWKALAKRYRCHYETLQRALDPDFAETERARLRELQRRRNAGELMRDVTAEKRATHREVLKRLQEIPPDTRDLTQRMMDDPLPGRSALDRRLSA